MKIAPHTDLSRVASSRPLVMWNEDAGYEGGRNKEYVGNCVEGACVIV